MLLRKSRKHLQGASNRTPFAFSYASYKPASLPHKFPTRQNLTSSSHLKQRHAPLRNSQGQGDSPPQSRLQKQLRKIYQGRRNIVKAVDGWGFDARGFITRHEFAQKLAEKLGTQPNEEEVAELLQKHCKDGQRVDAQELIELIHGKSDGGLFDQRLFSTQEESRQRQQMVQNLKEDARTHQQSHKCQIDYPSIDKFLFKLNSSISRIKHLAEGVLPASKEIFFQQLIQQANYHPHQKEALKKIESSLDYDQMRYSIQAHTSVDHLFLDPLLRKTYQARTATHPNANSPPSEPFLNKIAKSSTTQLGFLRNSQKRADFDPLSMLHTNQQKTRFGGYRLMQEWCEETVKENVSPNQKELVLQAIRSEADIHRQRYQNKLFRLRQAQLAQSEQAARLEEQAQSREQRRLSRIRHEQEAYNYVNFLKKRWD